MARPPEDPRVTDLRRYKREREQAKRKPPPKPAGPKQGLLGSNPKAGLILAILAAVVLGLWVVPAVMRIL